jgi:LL-diaminopimelate aminotransferase
MQMTERYVQDMFAKRIGGKAFGREDILYKFEKIKQAKRQALQAFPELELIDLGVGEPDWIADEHAIFILAEEAGKWDNRGYADNGAIEFKEAAAGYMNRITRLMER